MSAITQETATNIDHRTYDRTLEDIQKYIDTRLDIFEHKFLVFALNVNDTHWISVVVVNPLLVFHPYLENGKEDGGSNVLLGDDDFAGWWCVLNSTQRLREREHRGFQGTSHTRNNPKYGVCLFLNICASHLKARMENKGDGRQQDNFQYEQPFGNFEEVLGTEQFPQFDFDCPSILSQSTANDCGFAVVVNSMLSVNHLKGKQFLKSKMKKNPTQGQGVCFLLDGENVFSTTLLGQSHCESKQYTTW
jgi:hypothetical protein